MSKPNQYNGALIIDKPEGLTSHDVVARLRRILQTKKIGHTGTLDPFATGVLVMLVGKATRLARYLDKDRKSYEAVLRFGFETETGDKEGKRKGSREEGLGNTAKGKGGESAKEKHGEAEPISTARGSEWQSEPPAVAGGSEEGIGDEGHEEGVRSQESGFREEGARDEGQGAGFRSQDSGFRIQDSAVSDLPSREELISRVEGVIPEFTGSITQIPPMYSAKKLKGKKLYQLARQGIEVERKPIEINIYNLSIIEEEVEDPSEIGLAIKCSAGTYIRTLAEDIGRRIGIGCHLSALRRTRAGQFRIDKAITLEQLQEIVDKGNTEESLVPMNKVVAHLPSQTLDEADLKQIAHGMKIDARISSDSVQNIRLTNPVDELVAIGEIDPNGMIQPKVVFISE